MSLDVVVRLTEWGFWARNRVHYGHCFSIEHRYRPPQCWYPEEARPVVVTSQAVEVERAVRHLPKRVRLALKLVYVLRMDADMAAKRARVQAYAWSEFLDYSHALCANRLTMQEKRRITPPDYRIPTPVETMAP